MSFTGLQDSKFVLDTEASRASIPVPDWKAFMKASGDGGVFVSPQNVEALRVFEGQTDEAIGELLYTGNNGTEFGEAILNILSSIRDTNVLKYTLLMVEDAIIPDVAVRAEKLFGLSNNPVDLLSDDLEPQDSGLKLQLSPFVKLINHDDAIISCKSLYLSSLLYSVSGRHEDQMNDLKVVLSTIISHLKGDASVPVSVDSGLQSLSVILRNYHVRSIFDQMDGINLLLDFVDHMFSQLGSDAQYMAILCTWLASFDDNAASKIEQAGLTVLVRVLRMEPRLRVTRLVISTIRIVLARDADKLPSLCEALIELKLHKNLQQISNKKGMNDQELLDDIEYLTDALSKNFKVLSTFERHHQELLTKKLNKKSITHEELFWRENALKFEFNNFQSVKLLVELLSSDDPQTIAVACSDIGFFVQYFPNGKMIVERYGGKQQIMKLLSHENPEVQKQALSACSKIMVTNWESFKA